MAGILFEQIENDRVDPAGIISRFTSDEEQNEVGSLFNTKLQDINTPDERSRAIKDLLVKVKTYSFERQAREGEASDIERMTQALENKKKLQQIKSLKIILS